MQKKPLVIFGSSGHAKVAIDIAEKQGMYEIIGLLDSFRPAGEMTLGYSILGQEDLLTELITRYSDLEVFVAIGDNYSRFGISEKIRNLLPDVKFATLIHPRAVIGRDVVIGQGTVIMPGAIINAASSVGQFVIVNTGASVDHDCVLMDYSSIAPGCILGGTVFVGEYTAVSMGSTLKHGIRIGEHTVVGAGALVMKDCVAYAVVYGVPARYIRSREAGEKYL